MSLLSPSASPGTAVEQLGEWLADDAPPPLVIDTSGSTGAPKRVVLPRAAVLASVAASAARLAVSGRWLLALPSSYVAGVQVVCRSLVAGHVPVLVHGLDVASACERAGDDVPVLISLVPTQLHRLLDRPEQSAALAAMCTVLVGGGPFDPALRRRATDAGVRVVATYGASETAGGCVYDGVALDGVALAIGADGRVRIGGPTVFSGYDGDPALTAETLVDGWFLTSDAGRLDEHGRLQLLGRLDDVVVSGGVNVALPSVAARLREHPGVAEVEVLGVPDVEWGTRVVAFVVGPADAAQLRDWVAAAHPRAWVPREVRHLDVLPLLSTGKVDRSALRGLV